jgi:hypothetical protein
LCFTISRKENGQEDQTKTKQASFTTTCYNAIEKLALYCNFANKWGAFFAFLYNGGERSEPVFLKMVWGCIIEMRFD